MQVTEEAKEAPRRHGGLKQPYLPCNQKVTVQLACPVGECCGRTKQGKLREGLLLGDDAIVHKRTAVADCVTARAEQLIA